MEYGLLTAEMQGGRGKRRDGRRFQYASAFEAIDRNVEKYALGPRPRLTDAGWKALIARALRRDRGHPAKTVECLA
jgi:hypothetical protein